MDDSESNQDFAVNGLTDYSANAVELPHGALKTHEQVPDVNAIHSYEVFLGTMPRTWRGFWLYGKFAIVIGLASQIARLATDGDWHRLSDPTFYTAIIFSQVVVLLIFVLMYFFAPNSPFSKKNSISLSATGLDFSKSNFGTLMGHYVRRWDDIHSIGLTGLSNWNIARWERRLNTKTTLVINFISGGCIWLWLDNISAEEATKLFEAIEAYADPTTLNTEAAQLKQSLLLGATAGKDLSFNWAIDLDSQYSTTNFGTLPPNYLLQIGRYQIITQLSGGGLSAVYLAKNESGERVVIKETVLPPDLADAARKKTEELTEREANILSKLVHPHIAKILDYFVERERSYLVLEYIAGPTLRQFVLKKGPMHRDIVINIGKQLTDVLIFLHSQIPPIIHRDISPDNIIWYQENKAILIDFGAANEFIEGATGTIIGKQSYMAPEQVRGKAELLSDIYSFGGTMYFLLTGKDPTPLSQVRPGDVNTGVFGELDLLVAACTAQDSLDRPKSAEAVFDQLSLLANHQRVK